MEDKFIHSIKVPNQYRKAAKLLKQTFESGQSVRGQIFEQKHVLTNRLYALVAKISKYKPKLDVLIERSSILQNEPRLDKYMCLVLMTELLFGAEKLNGESKPVTCVLGYESKFRELLTDIDNDPTNSILQRIDVVKPRYVRVNTNILSRADALEFFVKDGWNEIVGDFTDYDKFLEVVRNLGDFDFVSDMHVKNLFVFPANSKQYWAKCASSGSEKTFILQDKASCLPVTLLDPPKGSIVLDMCAAPGMKTTHLAAQLRNRGKIYAVERDERRYKTLSEFVVGTKSTSVTAMQLDALLLEDHNCPNVEYILVDPSCSSSGMTNRLFVSAEKDPNRLANLTGLQSRMLSHAMRAFTKAKKIVYSTCSIHHEENEKVVQECLEMCPDWKLMKPLEFAEKWKHFGSPKFKHIGKKCIYAKSEIDLTDGFFVAIFEREIDPSKPIEPYSRNEAVLERINFNLKRKYPTETTADFENSIGETAVDVPIDDDVNGTRTDDVNGTRTENGHKKKEKRKDNDCVTDDVIVTATTTSNQETAEPEESSTKKSKKRKKSSSEFEEKSADEPENDKCKKEKRKTIDEENVSSPPILDESVSVDDEKVKKKKRKKVDNEPCSTETILNDEGDQTVDVSASVEKVKKKKRKKHDNDLCSSETVLNEEGDRAIDASADVLVVADEHSIKTKKKKSKNK